MRFILKKVSKRIEKNIKVLEVCLFIDLTFESERCGVISQTWTAVRLNSLNQFYIVPEENLDSRIHLQYIYFTRGFVVVQCNDLTFINVCKHAGIGFERLVDYAFLNMSAFLFHKRHEASTCHEHQLPSRRPNGKTSSRCCRRHFEKIGTKLLHDAFPSVFTSCTGRYC